MIDLNTMGLSRSLQGDLRRYFAAEWRGDGAAVMRCDVALALLRLGSAEARAAAQRLLGVEIRVCPPAVPPWPPDPIPARHRRPCVVRVVSPNPCAPKSRAHLRFSKVKVGLTVDQLTGRGVTKRDLRVWKKRGYLEVSP